MMHWPRRSSGDELMSERVTGRQLVFKDDFDGPDLDATVWLPHYLPVWSSRAETAATYDIRTPTGQRAKTPVTCPRWS